MGALSSTYHLLRLYRRLHWSRDQLEALRRRKLTALLQFCYQRIPYYQEKFREIGAQPGDFHQPEDLSQFPILEKETLRDRLGEFMEPGMDRRSLIRYCSSGSTGIPLELWYHPQERLRLGHAVTRELLLNGLKPWHRLVNLTEPRHASPKNRWYHRRGMMNERFLSVYDKSDLNLAQLRQIRPDVIIGFPSVLMVLGDFLEKAEELALRPKLLFTLAEVLTPEDREILRRQWGVEPLDLYGANEVGHIAFQCRLRQGFHLNIDSLHVEIMSGEQQAEVGERGEVVVTNFDLRVVPIIRYRVGDVAHLQSDSCSCGCRFPLLGSIAGRSDGFIIGKNGQIFSALEISLLLKSLADVKQYRLIQKSPGQVAVEFVAGDPAAGLESQTLQILRERLGDQMEITMRRVAEILPEKSGKIRTVISALPNPYYQLS